MANSAGVKAYLHVDGFDGFLREAFDKSQIRKAMRKVGKVIASQAQMNIALARGKGEYPRSRTGRLVRSVSFKVSRPGFLVRIAPNKIAGMKEYYPAYLHYGVTGKARRRDGRAQIKDGKWRIRPRGNYMEDALSDRESDVRSILAAAFAASLK